MTPPELEFKQEDFTHEALAGYPPEMNMAAVIADKANRILTDKLAKCSKVYGKQDQRRWIVDSQPECDDTCTAHLVGIKEIKK